MSLFPSPRKRGAPPDTLCLVSINEAEQVTRHLERMRELREEHRDPRQIRAQRELTRWQAARLAGTHDDLLRHPRSRGAIEFFLAHLYAPQDFSRRDEDLEKIAPILKRILPSSSLRTIALALEMNILTEEVDRILLTELSSTEPIIEDDYVEAYRRCDNYDRRLRQVELIHIVGYHLDDVVKLPGAYMALRLARGPSRLAGLGEFQQMLEDGFQAFRQIGGARNFLDTIVSREQKILDQIFTGQPRPFEVD